MSGRLEVGCQVMIVAATGTSPRVMARQKGLIGARGTLTKGPYQHRGRTCWDLVGDDIKAAKESAPRLWTVRPCTPNMKQVPASVLIRIDDPDARLDDGVPADEPSIAGA